MTFVPAAPLKVTLPSSDSTTHPQMFVIPVLVSHCTLDLRVHEELPRVVWESKTWMINGSDISRNEKALNDFHGLKAGELACGCFPLAPFHKLRVCADFMNWLWHLDDISDDMDDRNTVTIGNEVMAIYNHPNTCDPKTNVAKLTKSYWTRFISDGSPRSQKRFIHTMDLFFRAIKIQAHNRAANVIPDLEEYIVLRRDTSACKPCWALVEYANGLDLPDEVMEHPIILSLDEAANDSIAWSNDILSYGREQGRSDTHNMVAIMTHHHRMSLQEAVNFVGDLCDKSFDRFVENKARLPSWGPEIDGQVQTYVQGLEDWMVSTLHWSFDSERYFGKKGLQVKKSRVVELAPVVVPKPTALADLPALTGSAVF